MSAGPAQRCPGARAASWPATPGTIPPESKIGDSVSAAAAAFPKGKTHRQARDAEWRAARINFAMIVVSNVLRIALDLRQQPGMLAPGEHPFSLQHLKCDPIGRPLASSRPSWLQALHEPPRC